MLELILIRGLPGSGKSTLARKEYPNHLHYETDHLFCDTKGNYRWQGDMQERADDWMFEMVDRALSRNENVVVSDIFLTLTALQPYADLAKFHKADLKILEAKDGTGNIHGVPFKVMQAMRDSWEEL